MMAVDEPGDDKLPAASEARGAREAVHRPVGAVPAGRRTQGPRPCPLRAAPSHPAGSGS